jgi:hypothetical protein
MNLEARRQRPVDACKVLPTAGVPEILGTLLSNGLPAAFDPWVAAMATVAPTTPIAADDTSSAHASLRDKAKPPFRIRKTRAILPLSAVVGRSLSRDRSKRRE